MKVLSNVNNSKTDATVASDGVTAFKQLRVLTPPVFPNDAVNKAYVDKVAITDKYLPGDVMLRPTITTPTGFLKCNGAELVKTMYPALYAAIGDAHSVYTVPGSGTPWRNQYTMNSVLNGPLTDWVAGSALLASNMAFQVAVTKNRIYIFGRNTNTTTSTNNIYTATIDSSGTIGTWSSSSVVLPVSGVHRAQIFAYLGKLYLIGGYNSAGQKNVWRCDINTDGTITSFTVMATLPFTAYDHECAPIQNKVFLGGGFQNGAASAAIYCAAIDSSGNFGTWYSSSTNPAIVDFPYAVTSHVMTMVNRRGYLIGGLVNGTTATSAIYYSEFDDAGNMSAWQGSAPFPETVYGASIYVSNEKIYVVGGTMNGALSNRIYFAQIHADGSLGSWSSAGTIPVATSNARTVITGGKIYFLGGYNGTAALTTTYYMIMPGGYNDYSPYYTGVYGITPVDKFKLPDYSHTDNKYYFFIKY